MFNYVSTAICNPNNEEALPNHYFPRDVAENVPKMIRSLAGCWGALSVIGLIMVFPYEEEEDKKIDNGLEAILDKQIESQSEEIVEEESISKGKI